MYCLQALVDTILWFRAKHPSKQVLHLLPQSVEDLNRASIWTVFSQVENNSQPTRNLIGNIQFDPDYVSNNFLDSGTAPIETS